MGGPILIIEENERLRQLMCEWLEAVFPSCEVIAAPHHDAALFAAASRSPRAVLIEVDTLGAGAVQAIGGLKEAMPEAAIVALTMDDHEALRQAVGAAGASACVGRAEMGERLPSMLGTVLSRDLTAIRSVKTKATLACV